MLRFFVFQSYPRSENPDLGHPDYLLIQIWATALPPISCGTMGQRDLSWFPLPAAMMTTASFELDST
jgi:hypothetical protein